MIVLSVKDLGEVRNLLGKREELDEAEGYPLDQQATKEVPLE